MLDMIHHKKFPFTGLQGNNHVQRSLPGIPVMNQARPIPTSDLILLMWTVVLPCKLVRGSIVSTITRIYTGRSGVQTLDRARELSFLQNIQASSSAHPASNSMKNRAFSLTVKWPRQTIRPLTCV
jgi:hypothetical protein